MPKLARNVLDPRVCLMPKLARNVLDPRVVVEETLEILQTTTMRLLPMTMRLELIVPILGVRLQPTLRRCAQCAGKKFVPYVVSVTVARFGLPPPQTVLK
jgi:hypothetical protein